MTGQESPRPGSSATQRRFSVLPHFAGKPVSVEDPEPPGPRNCGQSAAAAKQETRNKKQEAKVCAIRLFMAVLVLIVSFPAQCIPRRTPALTPTEQQRALHEPPHRSACTPRSTTAPDRVGNSS